MRYIEWEEAHTLSNFTSVIAAVIWLSRSLNASGEANHEIGRRAPDELMRTARVQHAGTTHRSFRFDGRGSLK